MTELLALFEGVSASAGVATEDRSGWTVERRLEQRIVDGDRNGIEADLDEAMAGGHTPLLIINDFLLAGMKTVGELFASGEMQLPFVLGSAETMKTAVAYLEPYMEKADQGGKGTMVLATVKGDVHDIGKNLVDIILTNNGYTVKNLGIKVGISDMVAALEESGADAIGMSGLLVKSTLIMRDNLEELNRRDLSHIPVILGGAALTRTYVERDLRKVYDGRLFYGKDAFEGLRTMDRLVELSKSGEDDPEFGTAIGGRDLGPRKSELRKQAARRGTGPGRDPPGGRPRWPPTIRPSSRRSSAAEWPRAWPSTHRHLPQRDRPLPQPVGVPPGEARTIRPSRSGSGACCASSCPRPRPASCCTPSGLGPLCRQCRRRRPGHLRGRARTNELMRYSFPRRQRSPGCASATSSARWIQANPTGPVSWW